MADLFGTLPDGREVQRLELRSGAMTAYVLTLGAIMQDLRLDGVGYPLVLGSPDLAGYLGPARYFGALVGRFANRIGHGKFQLNGRDYQTDRNFLDRHILHGGSDGSDRQIWQIKEQKSDAVSLVLTLPDGHMGFPGNLRICADIELSGDALSITALARTDAPTPCSFAHHGYFDLDGTGDIRNHRLSIEARQYLETDAELIPTGRVLDVEGTDFDFREARQIGQHGYDHNFCLSDKPQPLRPVAKLTGKSGLSMQVETTACGLQLYDGAYMKAVPGLDGRQYGPHAGVALEAQHWPDAPNHRGFPDAILQPGEVYSEKVVYRFIQ